jgi:hypothetical protein
MKIVPFSQFVNPNPTMKSLAKICRATRIAKKCFSSVDPLFVGSITIKFPRMSRYQKKTEFSPMQNKWNSRMIKSIPFD